ncbi:MAG: Uncharacterised protein [Halieaceae bacterium]|nr:MAG: Uncharacterised protein [Halieaceae bacterium]
MGLCDGFKRYVLAVERALLVLKYGHQLGGRRCVIRFSRAQGPLLTAAGQPSAKQDDEKGPHSLTSAKGAV